MGELAGSWSFLGVAPILFLRHLTCTSLVVILGASALSSLFSLQLGFIFVGGRRETLVSLAFCRGP